MKAEVINRVGSRSFASRFIKVEEFASDLAAGVASEWLNINARRNCLVPYRLFWLLTSRLLVFWA